MQKISTDCGASNHIRAREPIRCRECGHRIMYKPRTKRSASFPQSHICTCLHLMLNPFCAQWCSSTLVNPRFPSDFRHCHIIPRGLLPSSASLSYYRQRSLGIQPAFCYLRRRSVPPSVLLVKIIASWLRIAHSEGSRKKLRHEVRMRCLLALVFGPAEYTILLSHSCEMRMVPVIIGWYF